MKFLKQILIIIIISMMTSQGFSKEWPKGSLGGHGSFGLGIGLPYGGIGMRLGINIVDGLNLYGGLGYYFASAGANTGLRYEFKSDQNTQMYLTALYGANAAIQITGNRKYNGVFLGPSFGFGTKINHKNNTGSHMDIGIIIPIRNQKFTHNYNQIKNRPEVSEVFPFTFAFAYNFGF